VNSSGDGRIAAASFGWPIFREIAQFRIAVSTMRSQDFGRACENSFEGIWMEWIELRDWNKNCLKLDAKK